MALKLVLYSIYPQMQARILGEINQLGSVICKTLFQREVCGMTQDLADV
jgi:hypothetical protein